MTTHLFAGIVVRRHCIDAVVINQNGQALLTSQAPFLFLEGDLPDMFDHLHQFAGMHDAQLHVALCDLSRPEPLYDPEDPDFSDIILIPKDVLYATDLPRDTMMGKDRYCDPMVVAAIGSLKLAHIPSSQRFQSSLCKAPCSA